MNDDFGKLILRLAVGGLLLVHGVTKLLNGIAPIKDMIVGHHLPDVIAYGVYLGEIVGPILIILGVFARIGALLVVADLIAAIALTGMANILALNQYGGYALDLQALYLFGGLSIALLGSGRIGLNIGGRWT